MKLIAVTVFAVLICSALSPCAVAQQSVPPVGFLKGNSTGPVDAFGASIASYRETTAPFREWLFVGAPLERSSRGKLDGAVYIYRRHGATFQLVQKLVGVGVSEGAEGDRFGAGVVAKKGWLLVASPNYQDFSDIGFFFPTDRPATDTNPPFWYSGRVHVYRFNDSPSVNKWVEIQAFPSSFPRREGHYGARNFSSHMAISDDGEALAIGEPDTYDATSPERQGISRLYVKRHWQPGIVEWCCEQKIDVVSDTPTTDVMAADSVVALPGGRFAVDVHVRDLSAPFSTDAKSSHGEIWIYRPGGEQFGDILSRIPVQKIVGETFEAGSCSLVNQRPGALSQAGFAGMAAGGAYFAAALPCAKGAAGLRTGRLDVYKVQPATELLQLAQSFEGAAAEMMLGSSIAAGQESVAIDETGCRILAGSTARGADVLLLARQHEFWGVQAKLTPGALLRTGFGQAVAFPYRTDRVVVGKINGVGQSRGIALLYNVRRCGTSP